MSMHKTTEQQSIESIQTNLIIVIHFLIKALKPFLGENDDKSKARAAIALGDISPTIDCLLWDVASFENREGKILSVSPIFMFCEFLRQKKLGHVKCKIFVTAKLLSSLIQQSSFGSINLSPAVQRIISRLRKGSMPRPEFTITEAYELLQIIDLVRVDLLSNNRFEIHNGDHTVRVYNLQPYCISFTRYIDDLIPVLINFEDKYLSAFTEFPRCIAYADSEDPPVGWPRLEKFALDTLHQAHRNQGFENFWIGSENIGTLTGFPESLFALEKAGHFSITKMRMKGLDGGRVELFIEGLRNDSAEEHKTPHLSDVMSTFGEPVLTMKKDNYGRICINDFNLRTPVADSPMDRLMVKLLDESKDELDSQAIKEVTGGTRPLTNIISDLGVSGDVRKLFFPKLSEKKMTFRRTITQRHLDDAKITLDHVMAALSQWKKNEVRRTKLK
ncbi:MAG: hypothetical protein ABIG34_04870 [Candidatus Peregrinibacteria bacterium]